MTAGNSKTFEITDGVITGNWNNATYEKYVIGVYVFENGQMTTVVPNYLGATNNNIECSYDTTTHIFTVNYKTMIYANTVNLYIYS